MSHLLDFVLALGPIFGTSTLLGDIRAKILGEWLLRQARSIGLASVLLALTALGFGVLIGVLFAVALVQQSLALTLEAVGEWAGSIGLLLFFVGTVGLFFVTGRLMKWEARVLGSLAMELHQEWRATLPSGSVPWPLNWFESSARPRDCFLLLIFWPVFLLEYLGGTIVLSALALLFIPLQLAEWLRQRLTPEKPHYLNIVAYMLSLCAMVLKIKAIFAH